jgi:hypothetical protein
MKDFLKLGSYNEFTKLNLIENILKKHPNFWTMIKFPKPPKWLYTKYLRVREFNVYDNKDIMATLTNEDIIKALMVLTLKDIITDDSTLTMHRILLHIKNKYDITLKKKHLFDVVEDAKQLVVKLQEKAIGIKEEDKSSPKIPTSLRILIK